MTKRPFNQSPAWLVLLPFMPSLENSCLPALLGRRFPCKISITCFTDLLRPEFDGWHFSNNLFFQLKPWVDWSLKLQMLISQSPTCFTGAVDISRTTRIHSIAAHFCPRMTRLPSSEQQNLLRMSAKARAQEAAKNRIKAKEDAIRKQEEQQNRVTMRPSSYVSPPAQVCQWHSCLQNWWWTSKNPTLWFKETYSE